MSRLPSPPLPSLLLPLLLLSLLASCLQQAGHCEAAASVPVEKVAVDGEHPVTDGVHSEIEGLPTPTEDLPTPSEDLPTPTEDLPSEDDGVPAATDDVPVSVRDSSDVWVCGAGQYILLGRCHHQRGTYRLCLSDSWCRSGRCRLGRCRRGTNDCRSGRPACGDGQQCVSEPDGWRCRAEDGTLALGAACSLDSECAYSTCSAEGTCVCPAAFAACDGHCCSVPHRNPTDVEATAGCPGGFTKCGGRCYHASTRYEDYAGAVAYCAGMGAFPATPRTAAENTCAKDEAAAVSGADTVWLGYRGSNTADSFVGADGGGGMSYTNWPASGEPGLDNCVILDPGNGLWADAGCHLGFSVICQAQN